MNRISTLALMLITCAGLAGQTSGDGIPEGMVLIPGGTFLMGSNANEYSPAFPAHTVKVGPFYMDRYEVTNKEYHAFCVETGHRLPEFWGMDVFRSGPDYPDHPVTGISHTDANEYARWAGKRLPTEAEWEYAARGGLKNMDFPFGEKADHDRARYNDPQAAKGPLPVGSFEANGYGLYDMAGNAWEWVQDWFDASYYRESPPENPQGPPFSTFRVFRGGGWHSGAGCISVHLRNALPPHWVDMAGGFRCARDVNPGSGSPLSAGSGR